MKSEKIIRNLLKQLEFDKMLEEEYPECKDTDSKRRDLIIFVLKWVLDEVK